MCLRRLGSFEIRNTQIWFLLDPLANADIAHYTHLKTASHGNCNRKPFLSERSSLLAPLWYHILARVPLRHPNSSWRTSLYLRSFRWGWQLLFRTPQATARTKGSCNTISEMTGKKSNRRYPVKTKEPERNSIHKRTILPKRCVKFHAWYRVRKVYCVTPKQDRKREPKCRVINQNLVSLVYNP